LSKCASLQGDGSSCANPLALPSDDDRFEFRQTASFLGTHVFACGPVGAPVSTRWVRWTARKSSEVKVRIELPPGSVDDYIVEVFSTAACDAAVSLGCNDNEKAGTLVPKTLFKGVAGSTYFVAVGRLTPASAAIASIRFDD
jgi:hypothetical protein